MFGVNVISIGHQESWDTWPYFQTWHILFSLVSVVFYVCLSVLRTARTGARACVCVLIDFTFNLSPLPLTWCHDANILTFPTRIAHSSTQLSELLEIWLASSMYTRTHTFQLMKMEKSENVMNCIRCRF